MIDGVWCDVMWCGVMWCDVMWCDVVWWCDVMLDADTVQSGGQLCQVPHRQQHDCRAEGHALQQLRQANQMFIAQYKNQMQCLQILYNLVPTV